MRIERLVKFEEIVTKVIKTQEQQFRKLEDEHPRSFKRVKEYKQALAKWEKAHKLRSKIYKKVDKAANEYVESFLPKPFFNFDISEEEFKALPKGEKIARRCAYRSRDSFSKVFEIADIVFHDEVQDLVEALDKNGINKVGIIDSSTALMGVLTTFIANGWKVVGNYERELPTVDKWIVNRSWYRFDKANGLLLVKE